MNIQGAIFDFDGTIVDSEPLWQRAEIETMNTEGLNLSEADTQNTKGINAYETVEFWYKKLSHPKKKAALLTQEMNQMVMEMLKTEGKLKPGVIEVLEFLKSKNIPVGIASGSSMAHIKIILDKFDLSPYFNLIYSIDFERFGKPHPGIYISACKKLKIDPMYSVSFEDSFNGMLAGKAARMKVVAILDAHQMNEPLYGFADLKIKSLADFKQKEFDYIESVLF